MISRPQSKSTYQVDEWAKTQTSLWDAVYDKAKVSAPLWQAYMKQCLQPCVLAMKNHLQENDWGNEFMRTSYVSTDAVESGFGKLDQTNCQSQRVDIWKNFGQTLCSSSGLFLTCRERLRREANRRKQAHEPPFTESEAKLFLLQEPLLGCDELDHEEELHIFIQCRKNTRAYFANIRLQKTQQIRLQKTHQRTSRKPSCPRRTKGV